MLSVLALAAVAGAPAPTVLQALLPGGRNLTVSVTHANRPSSRCPERIAWRASR